MFNKEEKIRYSRHFILPDFGQEAQQKLKQAKVLVVGAGGLGCPVLQYLTAAGVGTIGIVDDDTVSLSNLQRQILYTGADIGKSKVEAAIERLQLQNPHVKFVPFPTKLTLDNVQEIFAAFDIIVDGTDNFATRYLVNDACVLFGKINVFGSILKYEGQVAVFNAIDNNGNRTANYRDFFPQPPESGTVPSCAEAGVIGVLAGIIGTMQANEVIKLITATGTPLYNKVLVYNALTANSMVFQLSKDENNPLNTICSLSELKHDYETVSCEYIPGITYDELQQWQTEGKAFELLDVRTEEEFQAFNIGGVHIPLQEIPQKYHLLNRQQTYVVVCRSGVRSGQAIEILRRHGFLKLYNLQGGLQVLG